MSTVFEINHPGQVHLLKNLYHNLSNKGKRITVFSKG